MLRISDRDAQILEELIEAGVFTLMTGQELSQEEGLILSCCADGHQFHNLYGQFVGANLQHRPGKEPSIHVLTANGGPLLLAEEAPLDDLTTAEYRDQYLSQIGQSIFDLHKGEVVALTTHVPCGAAYGVGLELDQVIDLLIKASKAVEELLEDKTGNRVACFCHVDLGDGTEKKIYHINQDVWSEFQSEKE